MKCVFWGFCVPKYSQLGLYTLTNHVFELQVLCVKRNYELVSVLSSLEIMNAL